MRVELISEDSTCARKEQEEGKEGREGRKRRLIYLYISTCVRKGRRISETKGRGTEGNGRGIEGREGSEEEE
jgi:hypothetical protein